MSEIRLNMQGISKAFPGVQALDNVSFELRAGEIHSLVGENGAGKSTLIKVLGGVYGADSGTIEIDGKQVEIHTPNEAIQLGVGIIYQEFNLVPTLSIAENIFLGKEMCSGKGISRRLNRKAMYRAAEEVLARLNMQDMDVSVQVGSVSVAKQQLVEIAKALVNESGILVMDEPTAVLTDRETEALYEVMDMLRKQGIGIVFISHRLEEVQKMADRITVLRDGKKIATIDNAQKDVEKDEIVRHMVGRELTDYYPPALEGHSISDEVVLTVEKLSAEGMFSDVSFELHRGEILGFSGLIGAGRTEIAMTIFGAYAKSAGSVYVEGKELNARHISDAIEAGITLVPEDRKGSGLVLMMNMEDNIGLPNSKLVSSAGTIINEKRLKLAEKYIAELSIRPALPKRQVSEFSGGNQQKVVIAKWLATTPKILILDEPTRGVDVGAKAEIYALMRKLTAQGVSVIFISSEMPELLGMCDRILVMHEGSLSGSFMKKEFDQHEIMRAATGVAPKEV